MSENDVSFINMEYNAAVIALGEGTIDGAFIDIYNKDTLLAAMPDANILVDATDPETHKEMFGSEVCQTAIVTCTKAFAEENPETVQKFVNAHVKALKWINEHTSEEVAELLLPMFEGMTQEELASKFETVKGTFSETGEITPEGYAPVEEFCLEQGLIENEIPYEDIVATQFMNTALGK